MICNDIPKTMGDRIRVLREEKKMTQQMLADKFSIKRQIVSRWETDTDTFNIKVLERLAECLDTTCDYILRGNKPDNVAVSNDLGLLDNPIELLKLSAEIVRREKRNEDWSKLTFRWFDEKGKPIEIKRKSLVLQYARNTLDCANLLLGEPFAIDINGDRVIDYIMNYIRTNVVKGEAYYLQTEDNIEVNEVISGADILASKLIIIQQVLERLRNKQ